tara:strand:+ start:496 stop:669 length:174 start_codon:yes stop_codon:yes gene_type:complete
MYFEVDLKLDSEEITYMVFPQNIKDRDWLHVVNNLISKQKKLYPSKLIQFLNVKEYD